MKQPPLKWLYGQLPELVEKQVITAETAQALRQHYGAAEETEARTLPVLFALLGGLLVGLGVILLAAHNWEHLSRMQRAGLVMILLLVAQLGAGGVLWRFRSSLAWREGSAALLFLMVGASMALIGQTYHVTDDFNRFMLTWMVLALPLVYIMETAVTAMLYVVGINVWLLVGLESGELYGWSKYLSWLPLLAVVPCWLRLEREGSRRLAALLLWLLTISGYLAFAGILGGQLHRLMAAIAAALGSTIYLAGILRTDDSKAVWQQPLQVSGFILCLVMALVFSSRGFWSVLLKLREGFMPLESWLFGLLLLVSAGLIGRLLRSRDAAQLWPGMTGLLAGAGWLVLGSTGSTIIPVVLFNIYVLGWALSMLRRGLKERRMAVMNMGMLIICILITIRFFDHDFSFIVRGVIFVALGCGFLLSNLLFMRRNREAKKQ